MSTKPLDRCPTCNAPLPAINPVTVTITCEYCGAIAYRRADGVEDAGKRSRMSEGFTRLYRGATGTLRGERFRVEGRVRYDFGSGFWDEWYVAFQEGGSGVWVTEDDHTLAIQTPHRGNPPSTHGLQSGTQITLDDRKYLILETGEAKCLGIEGQLPIEILPDDAYGYVDATSLDGKWSLGIELDDEGGPAVYLGEWLEQKDLILDGEEEVSA